MFSSPWRHNRYYNSDSDGYNGYDDKQMRCLSCEKDYMPTESGTCKECYKEANETEKELKREIEELMAKVAFLKLLSPIDHHTRHHGPSCTDIVLVATEDSSLGPAVPAPAHKAVLVSRSPVFKAMLENDMEESRSGAVNISDASYDSLLAFVNYLYTAEASLDDQMAFNLLVLAEKYQVKHLKSYCEKYLVAKLNWDKSIANYAFAHQYNAKLLLDAALALITDNIDKLTIHEEYIDLVESNPRLVIEIYEKYLSKQVNTAAYRDFP